MHCEVLGPLGVLEALDHTKQQRHYIRDKAPHGYLYHNRPLWPLNAVSTPRRRLISTRMRSSWSPSQTLLLRSLRSFLQSHIRQHFFDEVVLSANNELLLYSNIIFKLLAFTFAMVTFPIGSYFLSVNMIFGGTLSLLLGSIITTRHTTKRPTSFTQCYFSCSPSRPHIEAPQYLTIKPGNSTYAGATAAIVANVVLLSYVVVAFNDDKSEREADLASGAIQPSEGRKDR